MTYCLVPPQQVSSSFRFVCNYSNKVVTYYAISICAVSSDLRMPPGLEDAIALSPLSLSGVGIARSKKRRNVNACLMALYTKLQEWYSYGLDQLITSVA
jgi:hypothetical protein